MKPRFSIPAVTDHFKQWAGISGAQQHQEIKSLVGNLNKSVAFNLEPAAVSMISHTKLDAAALAGLELPYDHLSIEWVDSGGVGRVVLAYQDEGSDGFNLYSFTKVDDGWLPVGLSALWVPFNALVQCSQWLTPLPDGKFSNGRSALFSTEFTDIMPAIRPFNLSMHAEHKAVGVEHIDFSEELRICLGLMAILSADGVRLRIEPEPTNLNKKRLKTGKTLVPEYRSILLTPDIVTRDGHGGSTGGSVRSHYRRGHIRAQPCKAGIRKIWIRPMLISGSGGTPDNKPVRIK